MKILTDRKEIAQALNFGRYPVVKIDCTPDPRDPDIIRGGAVKVLTGQYRGEDFYERCSVNIFAHYYHGDNHRHMTIGAGATMLTATMTVADLDEMATYANAPKIGKGDTVAFVLIGRNIGAVVLAEVKAVRQFCQQSAYFEDEAEDRIGNLAWEIATR